MTIRLYDKDVDMLDFSAVVKTCAQRENGYVVTLDQTAFFPEGGGQGADHGTLGGAQVLDAHDVHGEVEHLVSAPLAIGSEVRGHVDAARRLDMMQQHSGEHMFSGLVHGLFGYDNVGFHIGTEAVTMDFNGTLTEEDVRRVELLANQAVWRDQPVEAFVPGREALANIEYRSKKEIDGDVRIVRIEGVDTCACCGTHVHTTGAVGQIKVVGVQKYKSGVRVSILCGRRALAYENAMLDQAKAAGHALSVPTEELSGAVERMLGERDRLRAQNDALGMRIFDLLEPLRARIAEGLPVYGSCAGMILLADELVQQTAQETIGGLHVAVRRNAFGRQGDSFESDLTVKGVSDPSRPMHAVFIRAPWVEWAADDVEVLATAAGHPVVVRQGNLLASSFHPEMTDDLRLHQMLLAIIRDAAVV